MTSAAGAARRREQRDARRAAADYIARGFAVVPIATRQKKPSRLEGGRVVLLSGWERGGYTPEDIDPDGNEGLLLGEPSRGLTDVDLDTAAAVAAAPYYLPETGMIHSRASARTAHYWYLLDPAAPQTVRYRDPSGATLVELRSTGGQTVVPPSLHEHTGEPLEWERDGEPTKVDAPALQTAVRRTASAALLAPRWPDGARHDAALALAGLLLRGGMAQHDAERFLVVVARVAHDAEWHDRVRAVRDTAAALTNGTRATGAPTLAELLANGEAVVAKLREWLELRETLIPEVLDAPRVLDLAEFLRVEFPPRENIVAPVFPRQGLGMVHAWRGLGKTYFALSFGLAAAGATSLLRWRVERPWRALYVDGEMRGVDMQSRIASLLKGMPTSATLDPTAFRIITPDLQVNGIPDLATHGGQQWLDASLQDRELIILDNLSSLVRSGTDKEDDLWLPLQGWALRQRAAGRSVLFVHHDGKNETQRGTSRREDVLDTVFHLKKPRDYKATDGARFVLHFEKHRGFHGKDAEPFEVSLIEHDGNALAWTMTEIEDALTSQVAEMLNDGNSVTEITRELKIGRATVDRHKRKAIEKGIYDD